MTRCGNVRSRRSDILGRMPKNRLLSSFVLVVGLVLPCLALPVFAQPETEEGAAGTDDESLLPDRPLVIGTKVAPPFAIQAPDGSWSGISIELWRRIARGRGIEYTLEERTLEELITGLEDGSLDASVAALTMTAEREQRIDFSHPFYSSGLGIAVVPESGWAGMPWLRSLFSWDLLKALGGLLLLLFFVGLLAWYFERRHNEDEFGEGWSGVGDGFWWSAVTMTTVGYGDKSPRTVGGRVVALLWMFISVVTISGFTAAIASSLTVASLEFPVEGPEDLPRVTAGTVAASTSAAYLEHEGIRSKAFGSLAEALDGLEAGEVVAVVYDAPLLRYLARERSESSIEVLPGTFESQLYAIGLPQDTEIREALNREILKDLESRAWHDTLKRYLGE